MSVDLISRNLIYPALIEPGDSIGVISPSLPLAAQFPEKFDFSLEALERSLNVKTVLAPAVVRHKNGFVSDTAPARARALNNFIADDKIKAIFCAIGGFNSAEILPYVDFDSARKKPKILIGYSDCTAILLAMMARAGWVTFLGPMIMPQFGEYPLPYEFTLKSLNAALCEPVDSYRLEDPVEWTDERLEWANNDWRSRARKLTKNDGKVMWRSGPKNSFSGYLWGGNIETLNFLIGTPYLQTPAEIVLVWEATAEEAFLPRIKRALTHLDQAGILARTVAMFIGKCPDAVPLWESDLKEVVLSACEKYDFPVIADLPFGHTDPMATLPLGCLVEVNFDQGIEINIKKSKTLTQ